MLLVYGTNEPGMRGAVIMRDAAVQAGNPNVELWQVQGAGHGNYIEVAGDAYRIRVVAFWDAAMGE